MWMSGLISVSVRVVDMKTSDNHWIRLCHQQSKYCILRVISFKDWLLANKSITILCLGSPMQ